MPLFIPREWSQNRDTQLQNERREKSQGKVREALAMEGKSHDAGVLRNL
jgi:hypothetical protein